jgi:hypothetical protein
MGIAFEMALGSLRVTPNYANPVRGAIARRIIEHAKLCEGALKDLRPKRTLILLVPLVRRPADIASAGNVTTNPQGGGGGYQSPREIPENGGAPKG